MPPELTLILFTITRFLHVATAIALVGGTIFIRFVLLPSATAALSEDVHSQLRTQVMDRWKRFVHGGIGVLLLTGIINFARKIMVLKAAGVRDPLYHGVMGIKILLALAIFVIASGLVGRSQRFAFMRANPKSWIGLNVALALVVVGLSSFLRVKDAPPPTKPQAGQVATIVHQP